MDPMYTQQLGQIFPPPSQNTVGACDQITCHILYYISSTLVTLLKVTDAPRQVSYIFNCTVSFKILNFGFQIGLLFVPEMSIQRFLLCITVRHIQLKHIQGCSQEKVLQVR